MAAPNMTMSPTPPVAPVGGDLWWRTDKGDLYVFYDDGVSTQWVIAVVKASGGGGSSGGFDIQPVSAGGTGLPSIASGGVVVGSGANPLQVLVPSNGQVLVGSSGAAVWATSPSIAEITVPFIDGVQVIASDPASPLIIGTAGSSIFLSNGSTFSLEVINGNVYPNGPFTGATDLGDNTRHFGRVCVGFVELFPDSSHATVLLPVASGTVVSPVSITLPGITDTLVGRVTTDTLLHKTLSGATISGGVIAGTLSGGTISGATITGGVITGALMSGDTIVSPAISGGTISGVTISGTNTVANGAVISLGNGATLTGAVGATITLSGSLAVSGSIQVGSSGGITAHAGGGRASATNLNLPLSEITTVASAGDSVALLSAGGGVSQVVVNANVTNSITVFTRNGTSDTINALTSATGFPVAAGKTAAFYNPTVGKWYGGSLT